jgi:predicted Zn-dependent peptidase
MPNELDAVHRTLLPNGLVVITEQMPQFRSVSVGIWVRAGSRREPEELGGISHFIEHMVFKGTERRSCEEIAAAVDSVGGLLDAFTTKEMVCFNTKVLDEHLPLAFDVIADMALRPLFAPPDIEREKDVVLEEIKMDEDNPETSVNDALLQGVWEDNALGRPILGTPVTVRGLGRDKLSSWFRRCYAPNNLIISAAGNIEHPRLVDLVAGQFAAVPGGADGFRPEPPEARAPMLVTQKREMEQAHVCLGVPSYSATDPRRYSAAVLNSVLGSGMSSRLFQNIRERQGLAYAVFSETSSYHDTGLMTVYAGTSGEKVERLVRSVMEEFRRLKAEPVGDEELRRSKEQLKGAMTLGLESTGSRMANRARQEIYLNRFMTLEQIFASIDAVSADQVQHIAGQIFSPERIALSVLGRLDGFRPKRSLLDC